MLVLAQGLYSSMLVGLDLSLPVGSITGLLGKSKSEINNLLDVLSLRTGFYDGQYLLDNQNIAALPQPALDAKAKQIAFVKPELCLLKHKTLLQNLSLPLEQGGVPPDQTLISVQSILELFQLEDKINTYPDNLSRFQQIKLALARALLFNPKLLLLADITPQLASYQIRLLGHILQAWAQAAKSAVLWYTQNLNQIKFIIHQIAILQQGKIVEQSDVMQFLIDPKTELGHEIIKEQALRDLPSSIEQHLSAKEQDAHTPLIRLSFLGRTMEEPLIALLAQKFQLGVNIIQAYTEKLCTGTCSVFFIQLMGPKNNVSDSLTFLGTKGLNVDVIGYLPSSN
ncbi:MAG: NIL domain-containing protein [Gammaproteobacteria bacterium]